MTLTSCAPGEIAREEEKFGHGVFMYYVLDGLAGKADANRNGWVSMIELYLYANEKTKTYVARKYVDSQRPALKGDIDGDYPYGGASKGPDLQRPTTVGSYKANAFGLYDMHGNVYEWCADWYDEAYYKTSRVDDPAGSSFEASPRVYRGGSWDYGAGRCRSASRYGRSPSFRDDSLGFRVALGR